MNLCMLTQDSLIIEFVDMLVGCAIYNNLSNAAFWHLNIFNPILNEVVYPQKFICAFGIFFLTTKVSPSIVFKLMV